ncbi:hypothetical protein U1Q18_027180 [Sarracenia purpurea var. burkii]
MNPELTCFPIEEDPSTSGENENRGEVAGTNQTSQEDISSKVMTCGAKREHLAELTDACVDPATSVSAVERFPDRSSFDSVNTDISFNGTCSMVKEKHGNLSTKKRRCTNGAKGNQTSSVSTNCVWHAGLACLACWFSSSVNFISVYADFAPDPAAVLDNIDADFAVLSELIGSPSMDCSFHLRYGWEIHCLERFISNIGCCLYAACDSPFFGRWLCISAREDLGGLLLLLLQFEDNSGCFLCYDFGYFAVVAAFLRMSLAAFDVVAAEFWRFSLFIVTAEIACLLFAVSWSLC